MRVDKLVLNGFRNYEWESVDFAPGTNVISGENAQGKTNLLEAVYLLATGRSFRTRFDKELVNFAFSEGELLAEIFSHERQQTVASGFGPARPSASRSTACGRRPRSCRSFSTWCCSARTIWT